PLPAGRADCVLRGSPRRLCASSYAASPLRTDGPVRPVRVELGRYRRIGPVSDRPAVGDVGAGGVDRVRVAANSFGESGTPPMSLFFGIRTMNASRRF